MRLLLSQVMALLTFITYSNPSIADQYYSYFKKDCVNKLSVFELHEVGYFNVKDWPQSDVLEREYGLYTLGGFIGGNSEKQLSFSCGKYHIEIDFELRKEDAGIHQLYSRIAPILKVSRVDAKHKIVDVHIYVPFGYFPGNIKFFQIHPDSDDVDNVFVCVGKTDAAELQEDNKCYGKLISDSGKDSLVDSELEQEFK